MSLTRILAIAAASLAALGALAWGFVAFQNHYIAIGDQRGAGRVQGKWDAQKTVDQAASLRMQQEASAEQLLKFRNAERNQDEQAKREVAYQRRIAAGSVLANSLQHTITRLDQRDLSEGAGDARAGALAESATLARELLGNCTQRYRWMAGEADRLRDQVTGLLADAMYVCRASKETDNNLTNKQTTESAFEHPDH
jgi:hypothetical protein